MMLMMLMMLIRECFCSCIVDCLFVLGQHHDAPYVCPSFHLLSPHSAHQCTVSKTELGRRYDAIDMKCNLAHRACHCYPAKAHSLSVFGL
jgi:hypothetical protein